MLYRMHGIYGGLPSWRNPAKHPTSPHGSMAAGDCSDAAVQGLCAGRGMVEARGRSCWGTAGAHRSKQRSYVRLRRNTGPKATRPPAWECWRTGKLQSTESPCRTPGCAHLERRRHSAARSTCAAAFSVRSSPLGANTVCKSRNSFADALFTQGLMALMHMQPIICCWRAQSVRDFVTEFSGGATPHRSGVAQS